MRVTSSHPADCSDIWPQAMTAVVTEGAACLAGIVRSLQLHWPIQSHQKGNTQQSVAKTQMSNSKSLKTDHSLFHSNQGVQI